MESIDKNRPPKDEIVLIAPNGARRVEKYHPHDTVSKTLELGVKAFGKSGDLDPAQDYILVLGDSALDNSLTLAEARVKPGDSLKIRAKNRPVDGNAPRVK
jgi:hypothetical protein